MSLGAGVGREGDVWQGEGWGMGAASTQVIFLQPRRRHTTGRGQRDKRIAQNPPPPCSGADQAEAGSASKKRNRQTKKHQEGGGLTLENRNGVRGGGAPFPSWGIPCGGRGRGRGAGGSSAEASGQRAKQQRRTHKAERERERRPHACGPRLGWIQGVLRRVL